MPIAYCLNSQVRRVDEDRWLASRFAPAPARARLIALYALNHEIARVSETVREPAVGDIRLAWWREGIGEVHAGKPPRAHPVLSAYARAHSEAALPLDLFEALIAARSKDLDAAPFASAADLDAYLEATAGNLMRLALNAIGAPVLDDALIRTAARLWGYVGLARAEPVWRARGRNAAFSGGGTVQDLTARARTALQEFRATPRPPAPAFPALGYVALAPHYLAALAKGKQQTPLFERQLRMVAAAATGRI